MQIERTVTTTASPEKVWAFLSDFTTTTQWDPGTVETTVIQGDGGVGTTYRNISKFGGRQTELTYEVIRREEPTLFALRGVNKSVVAHDTMRFQPSGSGTEVTYTADFDFLGLARLAVPFLGRPLRKLGDEAEQGIRDALAKL